MMTTLAQLMTIGTEITTGEIVNSNAAWISRQLEEIGIRVRRHITVQDDLQEIIRALSTYAEEKVTIVTGGLGPTSDDCTRAAMAAYGKVPLEFDAGAWKDLQLLHQSRGLPLREAHKHQCYFPRGSTQLPNPAGSAIAFYQQIEGRHFFVLPGPPREVEGTWQQSVLGRVRSLVDNDGSSWVRWACIGVPESEIAELVEASIASENQSVEVGYRAAVPYVKVKLFLNLNLAEHIRLKKTVDDKLKPFLIGDGDVDLAKELLERWPAPGLAIQDNLSGSILSLRLLTAREECLQQGAPAPTLNFNPLKHCWASNVDYLRLEILGEEFRIQAQWNSHQITETRRLPFKIPLNSERGRRSASEWTLYTICRSLRQST